MNNGFFAGIIIIIIVVFGGVILYASDVYYDLNLFESDDNSTNFNNTNITNISDISNDDSGDVIAIQSGPASTKVGSNVEITWVVKNKGNSTITNVKAVDQNYECNFGSLDPGESKSINYSLYIPSTKDLKEAGFAVDSSDNDEFFIGGFQLSYLLNGEKYTVTSNSITILLN